MKTIKTLFLEVAHDKKPVPDLINALTDKNVADNIGEDERNAYQAFCCALLAKQVKNIMQKGQYIQEYALFIQKSLFVNPDCIISRLIRLMVEKQLQNVNFTNHINEDSQFISERTNTLTDEGLKELINEILKP